MNFSRSWRYDNRAHKAGNWSGFDLNLPTTGEYIIAKDNSPFLIEYSNRGAGVWISTLVMSMINDIDPIQKLINFFFLIFNSYKASK